MAATKKVIVAIRGKDEFSSVVTKAGTKTKDALRKVEKQQDRTKQSSKELKKAQLSLAGTMNRGKTAMLGFAAGALSIGAVVAGFRKLAQVATAAVGASAAQQQQFLKLDNTLRNLNINTAENRQHFRDLASEMQNVRGIADDVGAALFGQLLAFGATKENLEQVTAAVQDLSIGMGTDLKASALLMGKALAGEFGTLSRYGIIIDQNLTETEKMTEALRQIEMRFGGLGAAMTFTTKGAAELLFMKLGDIEERFGDILVKQKEWTVFLRGTTTTLALFEEELDIMATAIGSAGDASDLLASAMVFLGAAIDEKVMAPMRAAVFVMRLMGDSVLSVAENVPFLDSLAEAVREMSGDVFDSREAWEDGQDARHDAIESMGNFKREMLGIPQAIADAEAKLQENADDLTDTGDAAEGAAGDVMLLVESLDALIKKRDEAAQPKLEDIFPKPGDLKPQQADIPFEDPFAAQGASGASEDAEVERIRNTEVTVTRPSRETMDDILASFAEMDELIRIQTLEARQLLAEEELEAKQLELNELLEQQVLNEEAIAELLLEMSTDRVALLELEWAERLALVEGNTEAEFAMEAALDLKKKNLKKATEKEIGNIEKLSAKEKMQRNLMVAESALGALQTIFGDNKAFAIAGAIISTARGVAGALEIQPPPLGIALGVLIAAAGAVQIAKIRSSEPAGAAEGALITGNTLLEVGEGNRPELVVPLDNPRAKDALDSIRGGGGAIELTMVFQGPTFADEEDFGDMIVERFEDALDRGVIDRVRERRA